MLRLRRGLGQRIWITAGDERVIVEVASVAKNGSVELEFSASSAVRIDREEVAIRKVTEGRG